MSTISCEFKKGIFSENPTFTLVLGLCPTLAVSTTVNNAIGMGIAATFVLLGSNCLISLLRRLIPDEIRIPSYIVVIATFVSITEMIMQAYFPALDRALGIFVPLIVVNCIVLGRAEAFANKNTVSASLADAAGMGAGFTLALVLIAAIRQSLGSVAQMMVLAPGALLTMGLLIGAVNWWRGKSMKGSCHGCR